MALKHDEDNQKTIEAQLLRQLSIIEEKMFELEQEKKSVQRIIMRVRREDVARKDVSRKNSVDRVMVEEKILKTLRDNSKAIRTSILFSAAQQVNFNLKKNTFRSHLHRMKNKGQISSSDHGYWTINDDPIHSP